MSRMLLRAAMPMIVRNPTIEPSESTAPVTKAANTPPTSATGRVRMTSVASRQLANAACSSR